VPEQLQNLAAIDIGTSSVHLAIARPLEGGRPELLMREKMPVRLGSGPSDMKTLNPDAVDRALIALTHFKTLADAHDAEVFAVATSAVREAENQDEFVERVREQANIDVEIIAGTEEARLIHLGVLGAMPISDKNHLVIDIGGGSTEVVFGRGVTPEVLRSFKLGHVRLTDRFFSGGDISHASVAACRRFIRSFLARATATYPTSEIEVVAGASGTFETLARLVGAGRIVDEQSDPVSKREVSAIVESIVRARIDDAASVIPRVDGHRQDTILAGALLVESLMSMFQFDEFTVSPDALREGLVLDRLSRRETEGRDTLRHLDSIRAHSVDAVAERFDQNLDHVRQATDISLRIFDGTTELHGLGAYERDILEAAGMLHNIGRFIGHGSHHKHSYYLIRHTEQLAGFNEHERELIAQIARYHRKSAPKPSHAAFTDLAEDDQQVVSVLAGMLRIGIALDRTYRNVAGDVAVTTTDTEVSLRVDGEDLELELFSARERKGLLEDALGVLVTVDGTRPR